MNRNMGNVIASKIDLPPTDLQQVAQVQLEKQKYAKDYLEKEKRKLLFNLDEVKRYSQYHYLSLTEEDKKLGSPIEMYAASLWEEVQQFLFKELDKKSRKKNANTPINCVSNKSIPEPIRRMTRLPEVN